MRKIVRRVVEFQCDVCKTVYGSAKKAYNCERRVIEKKKFKKGDRVVGLEEHHCSQKERNFIPRGVVKKISGLEPMDYEYSLKWLGGALLDSHVRQYLVIYKCLCGENREHLYFSPELKKISRSLPIKGKHPGLDVLQKVFSKLY